MACVWLGFGTWRGCLSSMCVRSNNFALLCLHVPTLCGALDVFAVVRDLLFVAVK